ARKDMVFGQHQVARGVVDVVDIRIRYSSRQGQNLAAISVITLKVGPEHSGASDRYARFVLKSVAIGLANSVERFIRGSGLLSTSNVGAIGRERIKAPDAK